MLVNLCGRPHFVINPVPTATPLFYPEDLRKISKASLKNMLDGGGSFRNFK